MSNLLKKEKGFTLIEIVLVLAIAGLLMVIVFLAVSGAQKSRRDTQRKNDVGRIAAAIESYASNNNGTYPSNAVFPAAFWTSYVVSGNYSDPGSGTIYTPSAGAAAPVVPSGATSAGVVYNLATDCTGAAAGNRVYSVKIGLEQGGSACRDNH